VQAANSGANDLSARTAAQSEITALTDEITRISDSTSFGGTKLLDGTYGVKAATATGNTVNGVTLASAQLVTANDTFSITIDGGSTVVVGDTVANGSGGIFPNHGTIGPNPLNSSAQVIAEDIAAKTNAALATAGSVHAGNVTVTVSEADDSAPGAERYAFKMEVSGLEDGKNFVLADVFGGPLTDAGLPTGAAVAAAGDGGQFQIGANQVDTLKVTIDNIDAASLGIDTVDVTDPADANAAIELFDAAIAKVSTQRGELGAVQNRFESMINNLQVTTENLVASESRIRDTDMASEMTNFTKSQILSQAGTAMLAQANQVPQGVLSLLR
jgi:flagellin